MTPCEDYMCSVRHLPRKDLGETHRKRTKADYMATHCTDCDHRRTCF